MDRCYTCQSYVALRFGTAIIIYVSPVRSVVLLTRRHVMGFFDDKSERVMEVLNVVNALYPWLQSRDTETFKSYVKKKNQLVRHDQS